MSKKFEHSELENLCSHLGEDLDAASCLEIKRELNNCPDCSLVLDEIKGTIELYRKALPRQEVPGDVLKRLKIKLKMPGGG